MRLTENPFLVRAFALGFRSGPSSFRVGWFGMFLALVVGVPLLLWSLGTIDQETVVRIGFYILGYFIAAAFVFGGFQRMLISFAQERDRGTLDFIHLSTMPPRHVIWGLLFAGQIPGYIFLMAAFPLRSVG